MAPVRSIKKHVAARKPSSGKGALPASKSTAGVDDSRASKRDKRVSKHASFVSRIEKNAQKSPKRRRASKKLTTNLESLADALPETEAAALEDPAGQVNIIKQETLRHKPGALKRKQQIEKTERDRFGMNMAQLSGMHAPGATNPESNPDQPSTSNRWAALRGFVSQTMEQQPVFKDKK